MTDEERERLRLTLEGMANAAWPKHPKASAGDLVAPCRRVVAEMDNGGEHKPTNDAMRVTEGSRRNGSASLGQGPSS